MNSKEKYIRYVVDDLISKTEINVLGGDHKIGVYILFPFCKGWYNKRNFLTDDTYLKNYLEKKVMDTYALPRVDSTLLYENYYRTHLLEYFLKLEHGEKVTEGI